MNLEEYKGVYVFAEQVDNKLSGIAFELLGKAKDLAADLNAEVAAVLIGSDVKGLADELAAYGADKVIVVDDPELKEYRTEPYAHALASVIEKYKPEIMLVGATAIGRDLDPVTKNDTKCMMEKYNVNQLTSTALQEVKEDCFVVKSPEGEVYELPFDHGFVCLGMRAQSKVYEEVSKAYKDTNVRVENIGDSVRARRIIDGTFEGRNIIFTLEQKGFL